MRQELEMCVCLVVYDGVSLCGYDLVQNEDAGVLQGSPGDCDTLLLAATELHAYAVIVSHRLQSHKSRLSLTRELPP